jgi:hypothetical protein
MWEGVPIDDVKAAWARELEPFASRLDAVAWALGNLPPKPPNAVEFRRLCSEYRAPQVAAIEEPEVVVPPETVRAEMAKVADALRRTDHREWARRILARAEAGERVSALSVRFAKEALGIEQHGGGRA